MVSGLAEAAPASSEALPPCRARHAITADLLGSTQPRTASTPATSARAAGSRCLPYSDVRVVGQGVLAALPLHEAPAAQCLRLSAGRSTASLLSTAMSVASVIPCARWWDESELAAATVEHNVGACARGRMSPTSLFHIIDEKANRGSRTKREPLTTIDGDNHRPTPSEADDGADAASRLQKMAGVHSLPRPVGTTQFDPSRKAL
jgi:hypothetical protein